MDFDLGREQEDFRKRVRDFAEREIAPLVEEAEEKEAFPVHLFPRMGKEGLLCVRCPQQYGGPGLSKVCECLYMVELNRVCPGIAAALMVHGGLATDPILNSGTEEQKQRYLAPAAKGEMIGSFALTEPDAGSDAASIRTTAQKRGNQYVINGTKTFISNGTICHFVTLSAYTDPAKRGSGINLFIVERGDTGFSVVSKLMKMGNRSTETAELAFDDCLVSRRRMIGEKEGGGLEQLTETLKSGRITYAARSTGVAQAVFETLLDYVRETQRGGRPLSRYQAIRFKVADIAMLLDAMRHMTYRAAWLFDQGRANMKDASIAKLFTTESVQRVTSTAMRVQGDYGYVAKNPLQKYLRDARLFKVTEGTSEIQHLIIARGLEL
jgi:alkylation response protein AidB-like acyl-CoA dehydrogenase